MINPHEYTATHGLMTLLKYQNNYPADGTGAMALAAQAKNLLGPKIPPIMVEYSTATQLALFGDYPDSSDVAPSALFAALFSVIVILHLTLFSINYYRGHYFWLSLGWVFYAIIRVLGFGLRIQWSRDLSDTKVGITSEVFLILPTVLVASFNLILAQRIFTWRHPVGGSKNIFWGLMIGLYALVAGVVAMTIVASGGLNIYLLSEANYWRYKRVVMATSILIILYSLCAMALVTLAWVFQPTKNDENLYTYQPWWIESFSPLYFVKKGEPQRAAASFMKRNHNHRHAIRVIAATHTHHKTVKGLSNDRGELKHNISIMIVSVTTVIILVSSILRSVVCFQARMKYDAAPVGSAPVMYVFWGAFEFIVNLIYIIGRVDLRFYRPDRLPKDVRSIVTAEQSDVESDSDLDYNVTNEKQSTLSDERTRDLSNEIRDDDSHPDNDDDNYDLFFAPPDGEEYDDQDEFDFHDDKRKKPALPYPYKEKSDSQSEFRF
ncbi:hypothetical protein Cantr_00882 [Candida viswanathii]|uniref:Uncharacterized protein n=1 Tax=Candida viswanathii TaxID=5486 RepID=A0A367YH53_9ASCO|nr:hypothetical protein Cantr_00882 [Candida viswanathii]